MNKKKCSQWGTSYGVIHSDSNWHCNPNNSCRKWTTSYIRICCQHIINIRQLNIYVGYEARKPSLMTTFRFMLEMKKYFLCFSITTPITAVLTYLLMMIMVVASAVWHKRWKNKKTIKSNNAWYMKRKHLSARESVKNFSLLSFCIIFSYFVVLNLSKSMS